MLSTSSIMQMSMLMATAGIIQDETRFEIEWHQGVTLQIICIICTQSAVYKPRQG